MRTLSQLAPTLALLACTGASSPAADQIVRGLRGSFFATEDLTGPVVLNRLETRLVQSWGNGSPDPLVPADNFSARWEGWLIPDISGSWQLQGLADQRIRVWLDGLLVIDQWTSNGQAGRISPATTLEAGSAHRLRVEYAEKSGNASISLKIALSGANPAWREISPNWLLPSLIPVVSTASLTTEGLAAASIPLSASDADGDALTWSIVTAPTRGTATITADGVLTYAPTFHEDATDTVVAAVTDGTHRVQVSVPVTLHRLRGAGSGLAAAYFANNNLIQPPTLARTDASLAFDWRAAAPDTTLPADQFSARWTGFLTPTVSDDYTLIARCDDGVRVWLDGQLIIDRWVAQSVRDSTATAPVRLEAGRRYALRMEYYERTGLAVAQLDWSSSRTRREHIPADLLVPAHAPAVAAASVAVTGVATAAVALKVTDADGDALSWRIVTAPVAGTATLSDTGLLTYRATVNATGTDAVVVEVTDGTTPIRLTVPVTRTKLVGDGTGLAGAYFVGRTLEGLPLMERVDARLNFAWGTGSPTSTIPVDRFSARWTGFLEAPITDDYTLIASMDDGVRVWLDDQLVIDHWLDQAVRDHASAPIRLEAGRRYRLRVDYYENAGYANAKLSWSAATAPREVIPATALHPTAAPAIASARLAITGLDQVSTQLIGTHTVGSSLTWRIVTNPTAGSATISADGLLTYTSQRNADGVDAVVVEATDGVFPIRATVSIDRTRVRGNGTGLTGSYFTGTALAGQPLVQRLDPAVLFPWNAGSPDPSIPVDKFSARWTGWLTPAISDTYTLIARTDDGVRLWIDDRLVIDQWKLKGASDVSSSPIALIAGQRYRVRMEYYENLGSASAELAWSASSTVRTTIPKDVLSPSQAPVVDTATLTVTGLAPASIALVARDADADALRYAVIGTPAQGSASITANGVLTYRAAIDSEGSDAVTVEVADAWQATRISVPVTRHQGNRAPVPQPVSGTVIEDNIGTLDLVASDPNGDAVTWRLVTPPAIGSATLSTDGHLTYTPPVDWAGVTSLEVAVADSQGAETTLSITWTVVPVADPSVVRVVAAAVTEGPGALLPVTVQRMDTQLGLPLTDNVPLVVALHLTGNFAAGLAESFPATVTIPAGASSVTVNLAVSNDDRRLPRRTGTVTPAGGEPATLTIYDDDGQLVLDRHLPGYQETGVWDDDLAHGGFENHGSRQTVDPSASVRYDLSVLEPAPGWYHAEVFRIADGMASTAIPYTITAADGRFWTRLDHNPGGDARLATDGWVDLGDFRLDGTPADITVSGPPYGGAGHADAVRLTPVAGPRLEQIIDRGTIGYSEGSFWFDNSAPGHDGQGTRMAEADDALAWTSYNPTMAPGRYEVGFWAVTGPDSTAALAAEIHTTNGPVTIYTDLTTITEDGWVSLGTYDFEAGDGLVVLFNGYSWGTLRADAVRYRAVVPANGPTGNG